MTDTGGVMESVVEKVVGIKPDALKDGPRRLCKDCKHCHRAFSDFFIGSWANCEYAKCRRPTGETDLVSGRPKRIDNYCSTERGRFEIINHCGRAGKFWEAA